MARPTTTINLPLGWKAEVYTYYTQGEYQQIQRIFLQAAQFDAQKKDLQGNIPAIAAQEASVLAKKLVVVSLTDPDGGKVGISEETLAALPFDAESDPLSDHINSITAPSKKAETASS